MGGRLAMVRRDKPPKSDPMADHIVPHFHNDPGVAVIEIGAHEFMCVGARPPFDHPHVFLDMGADRKSSARIARRCTGTIPRSTPMPHGQRPAP